MKLPTLGSFALASLIGNLSYASSFPVTVDSCGRSVTFNSAPKRAVIHDQNMSQMAFSLGLQDRIAGLTGITGWDKTNAVFIVLAVRYLN